MFSAKHLENCATARGATRGRKGGRDREGIKCRSESAGLRRVAEVHLKLVTFQVTLHYSLPMLMRLFDYARDQDTFQKAPDQTPT